MYNQQFQTVLDEFLKSPAFADLKIGKIQKIHCLYQFERYFSVQRIYAIDGTENNKKVYIKLYKNAYRKSPERFTEAIRQDFETNLFWYKKLSPFTGFRTIKPLYLSLPHKAIVTEEAQGENLGVLVRCKLRFHASRETRNRLNQYMFKTGQLLGIIQQFEVDQIRYDLQDLVEDIDLRMRELVGIPRARFDPNLRKVILNFYQTHISEAKKRKLHIGYLHRDFMMGNFLVNGSEIVVHDFAKIDVGPGLLDLTRFYHHLELLKYKPIYSRKAVTQLQRSFLQGYGGQFQPDDLLFKFFLLRHYITHYKGLAKGEKEPMKSRLYNRWVMAGHRANIKKMITSECR